MSDIAIKAEGLGKKYIIGHQTENESYTAFRDVLAQNARTIWIKTRDLMRGRPIITGNTLEEVWVLNDLSFEIKQGDVVGIIGRNGAGKSTLLKILSRITEPTTGRVTIKGRVASLLEVGTGFHPELTGRENIYLNGSILGMNRSEIKKKFDEIVDFSGVEKFLDTPVKRYSSGMYVRLAFAVASHLDSDILIIDEVLAVGDFDFQKKCLGKMEGAAESGRTVLFVSHNLPMVSSLCKSCILLESGSIKSYGLASQVLAKYQTTSIAKNSAMNMNNSYSGSKNIMLNGVWLTDSKEINKQDFSIFDSVKVNVSFTIKKPQDLPLLPILHMIDSKGNYVFLSMPHDWKMDQTLSEGVYLATCELPAHFLNSGFYSITMQFNSIDNGHRLEVFEEHVLAFTITDSIIDNPYRNNANYSYEIPGVVRPLLSWQLNSQN